MPSPREQLKRLDELGQKATPGPWECHKGEDKLEITQDSFVIAPCPCCGQVAAECFAYDARFIAAASPATIQEISPARPDWNVSRAIRQHESKYGPLTDA